MASNTAYCTTVHTRDDDGSGGDNWNIGAISRAKLQSNHHQPTVFLQARCPSCRPTNSVEALKGKYHIPLICLPQAHMGSSKFIFDH